jgi:hypothetical protein
MTILGDLNRTALTHNGVVAAQGRPSAFKALLGLGIGKWRLLAHASVSPSKLP